MLSNPIFSVIVPTYNREKIIKRAINSIVNQTFVNFELIIVDDGSTDETKRIVEAYEDERIKYVYKENGGQNSALNRGLEVAIGKYIAFCDSDDEWLPDKLLKTYEKFKADDEIGVVYHLTGIRDNGLLELARNDVLEGWIYKEVLAQGYLTSPTFLTCKKECFDIIGKFDLNVINCQDDDLCFNLCKYFKVGLVKEILGIYYADVNNRKSDMKKTAADSFLFLWNKHEDEILEVCGKEQTAEKFYEASCKYLLIGEWKRAKMVLDKANNISSLNIVKKIKWYEILLKNYLKR